MFVDQLGVDQKGLRKRSTERKTKPETIVLITLKCFITVSVGMVRASIGHRLNMKTYIINASEVSRLSVAIHFSCHKP